MRMRSAVSLCACAVPLVYAHAQCRELMRMCTVQCFQFMRMGSAVSLCACAVPSVYAHGQCLKFMRMHSAISRCACAISSVYAHAPGLKFICNLFARANLCALGRNLRTCFIPFCLRAFLWPIDFMHVLHASVIRSCDHYFIDSLHPSVLKGQCHEIFDFYFFS
jgi:hypothetical protein